MYSLKSFFLPVLDRYPERNRKNYFLSHSSMFCKV
jgi:hypothetical protein